MGIEPFLITAALNAIVAQRLARRICGDCKKPLDLPPQALRDVQVPESLIGKFQLYKGDGCATCSNTGYKGRVAVYEVMAMEESVKEMVLNGASTAELKSEAMRTGMKTLRQSVITKLAEGVTTLAEVTRVSAAD